MELIKQRFSWDCELACVAMWCGKTYDEVYKMAFEIEPQGKFVGRGVDTHLKERLLRHYGKIPAIVLHAYSGIKGILSFPSLNIPGGGHALYYDGKSIFDPQFGNQDKKFYDESPKFWPGCYNITIDLKDKYSLKMFELETNGQLHLLKEVKGDSPTLQIPDDCDA